MSSHELLPSGVTNLELGQVISHELEDFSRVLSECDLVGSLDVARQVTKRSILA